MVKPVYQAVLVQGVCAACGADESSDTLGAVVFVRGQHNPDVICRTCWNVITISSAAKLRELGDQGVDIGKWATEALERVFEDLNGESVLPGPLL